MTDMTPLTLPTPTGTAPARATQSPFARLLRRPLAATALAVFVLIVAACLAAPWLTSYEPNATDLAASLQDPSWAHPLGTDQLGRDTLTRLLYGGRPSLLYAAVVAGVALLVGVPLGLVAGYLGGWTDRVVTMISDIGLAIPVMVMVIVVLSVFQDYFIVAMVILGLLLVPSVVRNIRGPVLAVRRELFVDAAMVAGLPSRQIIFRHVLPRVLGPVLVQAALISAMGMLFTVGLAYLGFGPQPPDPTWGSMVSEASQVLATSSWLLVFSGGVVGLVILCLGLLGDAIRDVTVESWTGETSAASRRRLRRKGPASPPPGATKGVTVSTPESTPDSATASAALLSVRGLTVTFERHGREVTVASNVDFSIEAGETVGLVGESGCGKTSVARSIVRLLASGGRVTAGDVSFDGRSVLGLTDRELTSYRGGCVSYIAQEPMTALDPTMRVGTLLQEVIRAHDPVPRAEARQRALELLETVRIPDPAQVARRYPHELSGGMAQRVGIARAIAAQPRLLIADEPTTALDVTVQSEILDLLRSLQRDRGMAILLVSHDWGVVAQLCERAMVMYAGELVEQGPATRLLTAPAHPYSTALLACRPSSLTDDDLPLPAISGSVPAPGSWPHGCRFAERCPHRVEACSTVPVAFERLEAGHESRCLRTHDLLASRNEAGTHA